MIKILLFFCKTSTNTLIEESKMARFIQFSIPLPDFISDVLRRGKLQLDCRFCI